MTHQNYCDYCGRLMQVEDVTCYEPDSGEPFPETLCEDCIQSRREDGYKVSSHAEAVELLRNLRAIWE